MIQGIHTSVKGRFRYKIKELYQSYSLKEYLERSLSNMSEIISVEANPLTSNILVIFEPNIQHENIGFLIEKFITELISLFVPPQALGFPSLSSGDGSLPADGVDDNRNYTPVNA